MNKRPHLKPYIYMMFAGAGAISLSILFFFLIYRFKGFGDALSTLLGILMPFVYGAVIAYVLKPVCNTIESFLQKLLPQKMEGLINFLSVACSLLFGILVVYALLMMIIPQLITSIVTLSSTLQSKLDLFITWLSDQYFADNQTLANSIEQTLDTLSATFTEWSKEIAMPSVQSVQNVVSGVGIGVWSVIVTVKNILIGLVVTVYLLASRKRFARQAKILLYSVVKPHWAQIILDEVSYADRMFGGFINGKVLDSAIIGVLCYIVCIVVKFPNALLVSAIIGVTNVIPFFGPFIGAVPATLLILIEDPIKALWFVLFILILQQLDGNIIGPNILGSSTGLSSFWVLFSILLFGGLWGFFGMLVGVPLFAVIYDIIKQLVIWGLKRNRQLGMMTRYHEEFGDPDTLEEAPSEQEPAELEQQTEAENHNWEKLQQIFHSEDPNPPKEQ